MTRALTMRVVAAAAVLAVLGGCTSAPSGSDDAAASGEVSSDSAVFPDSSVEDAIAELPHRSLAPPPAERLADSLVPPTNRWFSGLAFNADPEPVFPLPLSFGLTGSGFGLGVPTVATAADTIASAHVPAVTVDVTGMTSSEVSAYDDASVTVSLIGGSGASTGSLVIAQGSPAITFTAVGDAELRLGQAPTRAGDGVWSMDAAGSRYALITDGTLDGQTLTVADGATATWLAVPDGGDLSELASQVQPIRGVELSYRVDDSTVTTTLDYGADTLVAVMPHQRTSLEQPASCDLGVYPSVYGGLALCSTRTLSWTAPRVDATSSLDLTALTDAQRDMLAEQTASDIRTEEELPSDTYFGGKALYRLANLLDLAHQLGDDASAGLAADRLTAALTEWTRLDGCTDGGARCFVYDDRMRGIVGQTASFGSDAFNDHHFHYGYFLYAASVAARYDSGILHDIQPVMDLLAADLATSGDSTHFPVRRTFDAYAGHSWASGYVPFRDGNNQESSSEAVTAWNGLELWADVTGNGALATEAAWMLSAEAVSANAYWTDFDRSESVYDGYDHSIASINWGAKRDYSTWFSADPNAKLGILTLPMSPAAGYLGTDPDRITENLTAAVPNGYEVLYGDYLLMYSALRGPDEAEEALAIAQTFPAELIDDGDSRSYLLAFILSRMGG